MNKQFRQARPELALPACKPRAPGTDANGNTLGKVVGPSAPAAVPAAGANPPVSPETAAEADTRDKVLDGLQLGLDVVGLIPGFGEIADLANAGISAARGDWLGASLSVASAIPFAGWFATGAKAAKRVAAEAAAKTAKNLAEEAAEQAAKHSDEAAAAAKQSDEAAAAAKKGDDGGKVKGDGRDCRLRKYSEGCSGGKTPHHVVPDRVFRMPGNKGEYFSGGIPQREGYTICVDGATPTKRGPRANEHGLIHAMYDPTEAALGLMGDPQGTATLGEIEALAVAAASQVTGCNPIRMAAELRFYHQSRGLSLTDKFRADPTGALIRGVEPGTVGRGATSPGMGGI